MNDLKFALRQIFRQPTLTVVAVVSLAVGIGLNTAVFSIINAVFFQTLRGVPDPGRVVFANERVSRETFRELRSSVQSFSGLTAFQPESLDVSWRDQVRRVPIPTVADNYFAVLGVQPHLGRFFEAHPAASTAPHEVVLEYEFWRQECQADPAIVGQSLRLNGTVHTIVGVAPAAFHGPGPERPLLWVPLGNLSPLPPKAEEGKDRNLRLLGRLKEDVSLEQAQAELSVLLRSLSQRGDPGSQPVVLGIGREVWTGGTSLEKQAEFLLVTAVPLVAVGTLLLIACSNVANLLLARGVARRREMAIRLATGASRWRIVRQLLMEGALLAALGAGAGLLVSTWTVRFVFATFANYSRLEAPMDGRVLIYLGALAVLSTLLFALVPAWESSRADVSEALKSEGAGTSPGPSTSRLRNAFLIIQLAGAVALLVISATFVRSLLLSQFGETARFENQLLVAQLPELAAPLPEAEHRRDVRDALKSVPGVVAVTFQTAGPTELKLLPSDGSPPTTNTPTVRLTQIDSEFLAAVGQSLQAGRELSPSGANPSREILVNRAAVSRYWPEGSPLGRQLHLETWGALEVVGVLEDGEPLPNLYAAVRDGAVTPTVVIRTSAPAAESVESVRRILRQSAVSGSVVQVAPLRDLRRQGLKEMTQVSVLLGGLALALAATGIYGSMAFTSSQRVREMGIRMALGATRAQVMGLLVRQGLKVNVAAGLLGLLLALAAFQLLSGLIFGQWKLELSVLVAVWGIFALVTLLASWIPARAVGRTNPLTALRQN